MGNGMLAGLFVVSFLSLIFGLILFTNSIGELYYNKREWNQTNCLELILEFKALSSLKL